MKHLGCVLVLVLASCGGEGGEPAMTTVDYHYGDSTPKLDTGSAIEDPDDPTKMIVQLGDGGVDCGTNLAVFFDLSLPHGTFLYMQVAKMAGAYPNAEVSAMKVTSKSQDTQVSNGMVTIDAVGDRVTGSLTYMTTSEQAGTITASGTFDVKACF